ncbi:MAG: signal peptidase I [Alicyclobacillus herbarius]|uniref:signal peptidase I n=1 Tax=Alicyclobacillus herbarius TaxID=122960 RepID=UPI0003FF51ED|nr:signal peptidase I [Alicyclobacillus herbarius]MCL6631134.1 signal peptidase I [Alicyclobacillus herbarius]
MELSERESNRRSPLWRTVWEWVWPIALGCLVAWGIQKWIFGVAMVPSESMYPTINNPCYVLVDHLATEFHAPYEGEVVLFHWPDDPSKIFVKRIIGMPGDTIVVHDGHVYRNGKELYEPYVAPGGTKGDYGPYKVPAGEYFMMGDNRNVSDDSRFWQHRYVARSAIIGRADMVIWPLGKAHTIH